MSDSKHCLAAALPNCHSRYSTGATKLNLPDATLTTDWHTTWRSSIHPVTGLPTGRTALPVVPNLAAGHLTDATQFYGRPFGTTGGQAPHTHTFDT